MRVSGSRGHMRKPDRMRGSYRQYSGSGWRARGLCQAPPGGNRIVPRLRPLLADCCAITCPAARQGHRGGGSGRRLCRTETAGRPCRHRTLDGADRQAIRHRQRLRGTAAQMGPRAQLRIARPLPRIGKGLGEIHKKRTGLDAHRPHPANDPPTCKNLKSFIPF